MGTGWGLARDAAALVLACGSSSVSAFGGHQVTWGMPALSKATSPRNKGTRSAQEALRVLIVSPHSIVDIFLINVYKI